MLKHLKVVGLIAVLLGSTYVFYAMQTPFPKQIKSGLSIARVADDPQLTVTITSQTSVSLAWDTWGGDGNYQVTVKNLTTQQVEQSFSTASDHATVSNLTDGNTYRFSVEKNGYVIAEDVIM